MIHAFLLLGVLVSGQLDPLTHVATLTADLDVPGRIALTDTEILVADAKGNRVVRFDLAGNPLGFWPEPAGPVGIAVHPDGRIFVALRDGAKVGVYDGSFAFQHFLGEGVVTFEKPTDLAVETSTGRVYVVDSGADHVYGFDSAEELVLIFGIRGGSWSEFKYPGAIAVDEVNQRILVADQDNFRIQVFDRSGMYQDSFGYRIKYLPDWSAEGWIVRTTGLAVDAAGRIYVTDAVMSTVRVFTPDGAELGKVVDYGFGPGELRTPGGIALDGTGRVIVANSTASSVEIYEPLSGRGRGGRGTR